MFKKDMIEPKIEKYAFMHTAPEPQLLQNLIQETRATMDRPQMLTDRVVGRFLKLLVAMSGAKNILEIGMFTGYSALNMAEALPVDGTLMTCEINPKAELVAKKYFALSSHGHKIKICMGPALNTIETITELLDFVFIDADKANYLNYYKAVLPKVKSRGLIVFDNSLLDQRVLNPLDSDSQAIDETNKFILNDESVENVLLTVRDGVNIVRKI